MSVNRAHLHAGRHRGRSMGFTLIELMVTVAILGILMAIAVASYDFAMVKTRRGAAEGCLLENAQYMERFYTTNFRYDQDSTPAHNAPVLPTCSDDVRKYYDVSLASSAAKAFSLEAVPKGGQENSDTKCGTLTVNQAGQKTISGTGQTSDCW